MSRTTKFLISEFVQTAEAISLLNPYVKDMTVLEIRNHMIQTLNSTDDTVGYVSTLGYVLTFYRPEGHNEVWCKPSVDSYTVIRFFERTSNV